MKNIWSVFDTDMKNKVPLEELATIMRALDINVSNEGAIEEITAMIDTAAEGYITFEGLTVVMEDKLKETDTVEDMVEQLKKLDKNNDGKIPCPEFK